MNTDPTEIQEPIGLCKLEPGFGRGIHFGLGSNCCGKLTWDSGVFKFEGNAEESAKVFFDYVLKLSPEPSNQPCKHVHMCSCGTGDGTPHVLGSGTCVRRITDAPEFVGFREDGFEMWRVGGSVITDYTLIYQRGYHRHGCGCWSWWCDTCNSLPDET